MIQQKQSGITRNKLSDLLLRKTKLKSLRNRFSRQNLLRKHNPDQNENVKSTLLNQSTEATVVELQNEPQWIYTYKVCSSYLREVQDIQQDIVREKAKKLRGAEPQKQKKLIDNLLKEATQKLGICEKMLKNQKTGNNINELKISKGMIAGLAAQIKQQTNKIRMHKEEDLAHERQLRHYSRHSVLEEISTTQEGDFEMLEIQKQRQGIQQLAKSITALNTLYKQMQAMVIQQGSLLDRIDENIDETVFNVGKATVQLEKAAANQQSKCFKKARCVLVICIFFLLALFLIEHT